MNKKIPASSRSKNLCFITAVLITGGSDRLLQSLLPRFKALGYNITVYVAYPPLGKSSLQSDLEPTGISIKCPSSSSKKFLIYMGYLLFFPALIKYRGFCFLRKQKPMSITELFLPQIINSFVNPIFEILLISRVIFDHLFIKYSVISGYHYAMYSILYWIKTILKIPVFYTEISSPKYRAPGMIQRETKKYLNNFDKVFVPSSIIGEELKNYEGFQNNFLNIPFFVDLPKNLYQVPKKPARSFGLIGRLSQEKNQDILIQILKLVKREITDAKLILIGTGPLKQHLITTSISLDLRQNFQIIDDFEHIEEVIDEIDIFTLISDVEGMPLSIIEALFFGKPVIATPVGSIPDMVINNYNGYILNADQIQEIADHIIELMENFTKYKVMSQNSHLLYEKNYDPDIIFNKLLSYYDPPNLYNRIK
jgi:glycosyltransferase involved in cell wall biosynthesis